MIAPKYIHDFGYEDLFGTLSFVIIMPTPQ